MFHLSTGSFRDIESAILADLSAAKKKDPLARFLVLSPSGHMLTRLQMELSKRTQGLLNIHFLTFYALAERVLAQHIYNDLLVMEPAFFHELIRHFISAETGEELDLKLRKLFGFENRPIPRGLPAALAGTLKDLRDSGLRAKAGLHADFEGLLADTPEATATLALHSRLTGYLETHHVRTSADLLRRAAAVLPSHPWIAAQKRVSLYGFYDLTGVQLDFVTALASHPAARVYFPYEEGNPAYAYAEKLLKDPAFASKCKPHPELSPSLSLREREQNPLPSGEGAARAGEAKIEVWSCSGPRDEVWLAAKEILKLADEGVPFDQIGVASRNLTPYLPALRDIFRAHELPYLTSRGEPAGSHPLVKAVRALLNLDPQHLRLTTLLEDLKKSPYVRSAPVAEQIPVASGTWSFHAAWAADLISRHVILLADASREESALLSTLLKTFQELSILDTLRIEVSRRRFLEVWDDKLESLERPGAAIPHGGVRILDVQQARGLSFRVLFVLGMNEKVFPRLIREDPFLSDRARDKLAQATGCRLSRKMNGYDEERLLFELVRNIPSQRLYLLMQRSDEEGKALIPSVYLQELQRVAPKKTPVRLPRGTAEKFDLPSFNSPMVWTPKEFSFLINRLRDQSPEPLYKALGWKTAEFDRLIVSNNALENTKPGIGPHDGKIQDEKPIRAALQHGFSPSSLEDLAECPFQYYASRILRITPKEEFAPRGEMTAEALGILFHSTLEFFYTGCREKGLPKPPAELPKRLSEAVTRAFEKHAGDLSGVYPVALKSSKDIIYKYLLLFLEAEVEGLTSTGYKPAWFEQPLQGPIPQWTVPGVGDYHGQPDRIDIQEVGGETHVRVVDYKSGKPRPFSGKIETALIKGSHLQLPVYLALATAFAEKTLGRKITSGEAVLRQIRTPGENEKSLSTAFWNSPSAPLVAENIRELIGLVEKGQFYIEPSSGDQGYCHRCHFDRICRKEHMPTRLRAERDPARQRVSEKLDRSAPKNDH